MKLFKNYIIIIFFIYVFESLIFIKVVVKNKKFYFHITFEYIYITFLFFSKMFNFKFINLPLDKCSILLMILITWYKNFKMGLIKKKEKKNKGIMLKHKQK